MAQIRVLAIEDELLHTEQLRLLLEQNGFIVIDVVDTISEFKRMILATQPDILLVDIDLGEAINGIELMQGVSTTYDVPFIFLTAHEDQQTVKTAMATMPSAYLTKPYTGASLRAAIELANERHMKQPNSHSDSVKKMIFVRSEDRLIRIAPDELWMVEAQNKQCSITLGNEQFVVTAKLTELANQLSPDQFMQIHRSYIVNLDQIGEIDAQYRHLTIGDQEIPIGRSYKSALMEKLLKLG
ncbi:MAG: response regulator transcription factor [Cytophagales bacterium]|nr:response regulator transcription factor [Cytophagales bacterium]